MSKKRKEEAMLFSGSGSSIQAVQCLERNPETLSPSDLMVIEGETPQKPERISRFPVSAEEFEKLKVEATKPQAQAMGISALEDNNADSDEPSESLFTDIGEDGKVFSTSPQSLAPPVTASFAGIPATNLRPPDCHVAAGPNHVLAAVNSKLQVYTNAGVPLATWFSNPNVLYGSTLPAGAFVFDPRVLYDHYSNRWIIVFAATRSNPNGSWLMFAVSQTSNPLGSYWVWALNSSVDGSNPSNNWGDYPMVGFDTQAIYITTNQFAFGGGFAYSKLRILNKAQAYAGAALGWFDYWNIKNPDNSQVFTMQPCVHFRGVGGNPPAYLVNAIWANNNKLTVWTLRDPLNVAGQRALIGKSVACKSYSLPPQAQQKDSTIRINTNDTRLLNAVFQHTGNTLRLWTCHNSAFTWAGDTEARSAINWYEIDVNTFGVVQQNTYGAKGYYYFFPVIQTDLGRDAYLVFGRSNKDEYASIRQTGRLVTDPLHSLQGSSLVKAGLSANTGGRWGDYFGIARDPSDPQKIWGVGEYAAANNQWATWICSAKF
jgi:hypothetical protein